MRFFNLVKDVVNEKVDYQRVSLKSDYVAKHIVMALRDVPSRFMEQVRTLRKMGFGPKESMRIIEELDKAEDKAHVLAWHTGSRDAERDPTAPQDIQTHNKRINLYTWPLLYRQLQASPVAPEDKEAFVRFAHGVREDEEFTQWLDYTSRYLTEADAVMEAANPMSGRRFTPQQQQQIHAHIAARPVPQTMKYVQDLVKLFTNSGITYDGRSLPDMSQMMLLGQTLQRRGYDAEQRKQLVHMWYVANVNSAKQTGGKPDIPAVSKEFNRTLTNMYLKDMPDLIVPATIQASTAPVPSAAPAPTPTASAPTVGAPPAPRVGRGRGRRPLAVPPAPAGKPRVKRDAQGRWVYPNTKTPLDYVLDSTKNDDSVLNEGKKMKLRDLEKKAKEIQAPRNPNFKKMEEIRRSGAGGAHFDKKKGFKRAAEKQKFRKELSEGWLKHEDGTFSAEMSDIQAHQDSTGKAVRCPSCRQDMNMRGWKPKQDDEGDTMLWTGSCPSCRASMTVFNDSVQPKTKALTEAKTPRVVADLRAKLKKDIAGMEEAKAKAHIRKAINSYWKNVKWDIEKDEWNKHMTDAQKDAFVGALYKRLK